MAQDVLETALTLARPPSLWVWGDAPASYDGAPKWRRSFLAPTDKAKAISSLAPQTLPS
jgi:hypothetical protein